MSDIDVSKIKVGDKVKIRHHQAPAEYDFMDRWAESRDWMTVRESVDGSLITAPESYVLGHPRVEVTAHQPAPRKVEVTLGEPLVIDPRRYPAAEPNYPRFYAAKSLDRAVYLAAGGGESTVLDRDEARRLALDILATVGAE